MQTQALTEADLSQMTSGELVALHNRLAKPAGIPPVKRFATKPSAVRRVWALIELEQERAPANPEPTPASKATGKADDKTIRAGEAPDGRACISHGIHEIANRSGPIAREELIQKVLTEYKPPRTQRFDRAYVLGYIAYGLRQGYLREA